MDVLFLLADFGMHPDLDVWSDERLFRYNNRAAKILEKRNKG